VGGRQEIRLNARVIAATNCNLKKNMAKGTFREDLYYRVAVVQVLLPALRERENDILLLAKSFLQRFAGNANKVDFAFEPNSFEPCKNFPAKLRPPQPNWD
jgi:two-component system, NtrC family, response regulator